MPIGIITNVCAIFFGGIVGALTGKRMSQRLKDGLNMSFGICSMCMGIYAIAPLKNLAAVIFAVIIGTGIGLLCHLGTAINHGAAAMQRFISRFVKAPATFEKQAFEQTMVTVIVLFCASGTGIYGTLTDLDFFAAVIFGANLGLVVSLIAVPQLIILTALFLVAHLVFPLTTPDMILDFKAVGGILMVASGFRIIAVKMFPTADMIPMMVVIMPISWLWMNFALPLL